MVDYKNKFKASLKETVIKQLLDSMEKRYEERINKIINYQKSCEKSVEEIKKNYLVVQKNLNATTNSYAKK